MTRGEPVQRDDGRCARWGCKKQLPLIAVKEGDAFCSNDCCRKYHHVVFPKVTEHQGSRRGRFG